MNESLQLKSTQTVALKVHFIRFRNKLFVVVSAYIDAMVGAFRLIFYMGNLFAQVSRL